MSRIFLSWTKNLTSYILFTRAKNYLLLSHRITSQICGHSENYSLFNFVLHLIFSSLSVDSGPVPSIGTNRGTLIAYLQQCLPCWSQAVKAPMIPPPTQFLSQFFNSVFFFFHYSFANPLCPSSLSLSHWVPPSRSFKSPNLPKSSYTHTLSNTNPLFSLLHFSFSLLSYHQIRSHHTPISFFPSPIAPPIFHRSPSENAHFLQLIPATAMRMD